MDEEKLAAFTKTGIVNNNIVHPASFNNKPELHTGFLAQDVEKIAKELGYGFDGIYVPANAKDHYGLAYSQFVMPLVKAVQEQQQQIDELKKEKHIYLKKMDELKNRLDKIETQLRSK